MMVERTREIRSPRERSVNRIERSREGEREVEEEEGIKQITGLYRNVIHRCKMLRRE